MHAVVPVDAVLLQQMVVTGARGGAGLSPRAAAQYWTALSRTSWGRTHLRAVALVDDGARVLASTLRYELSGVLDGRPVSICALGEVTEYQGGGPGRHARELTAWLTADAERLGVAVAMVATQPVERGEEPAGFQVLPTMDVTLGVTESMRRGAPMAPVRSGDRGDLAAIADIAATPTRGAEPPRFRLERSADFIEFALTRGRLRAGLAPFGERELRFLVVEEGMRAAAYAFISIVGDTWVIEECGDRDPTGARVGAILQTLIAREPTARRPTITAWLPHGFLPPQVAVVAARPSAARLWVRPLASCTGLAGLSAAEIAYWHGDVM